MPTTRERTIGCPACGSAMERGHQGAIEVDACPRCHGLWLDPGELGAIKGSRRDLDDAAAFGGIGVFRRACPRCRSRLLLTKYREGLPVWIDRCSGCHGIFLDRRARRAILQKDTKPERWLRSTENPGLRETLEYYRRENSDRDLSGGDWLFQLLSGLPVELNAPPLRRPLMNWTLIGGCALVFVLGLANLQHWVALWGLVPSRFLAGEQVITLLTSLFVHGGILHAAGNLYFLWMLGDNVEDVLGHAGYLVFYLLAGIAASLAFVALHPHADLPLVGASGAISGVMGAYLVACPRAQVTFMIWFFQYKVPVVGYLVFWLLLQFLNLALGSPGVAWEAHLAGFAFGLLTMLVIKRLSRRGT